MLTPDGSGAGLPARAAAVLLGASFSVAVVKPPALLRVLPCTGVADSTLCASRDGSARVVVSDNTHR